jgi:O-methyltransferase/methyltransferase family protein
VALDAVLDLFTAHYRTAAVKAGIELDVFTAIGAGVDTARDLALRCGAVERGIRILCDYLTAIGLLAKEGERYALTPDAAAFLDQRSSTYLGSMVTATAGEAVLQGLAQLTAAVRHGGTVLRERGVLAPDHPYWAAFARAIAPAGRFMGPQLARLLEVGSGGRIRVLDVAAGHGLYGIAVAAQNPQAEIVALDWPSVLAVACEHAEAAGVADRYRTIPGSVLTEDLGKGYDLVLLTNFLPDLDAGTCEAVLAKVHAALVPGGRAVALQYVLRDDRIAPRAAVDLSLALLATTPGGDNYTFAELDRMFRSGGFARTELRELPPESVVIAYR